MALESSLDKNISFPDFGPSGSPTQAFDREFSQVNTGIQYNNPIPIVSPALPPTSPDSVDINQNLVGNEQTGPVPGAKQTSGGTTDFVKAVNSYMGQADQWAKDKYKYGRTYSYGAGYKNMNFERYYEHPEFKKLGFSPYRDNEQLYNENSSWMDDFRRMGTQWGKLFTTGVGSSLFLVDDDEAEEAMQKGMAIGSSSKEGAGAWITNFGLNSAYSLGIMTEIVVEDLALAGLEIATLGGSTPLTIAELGRQSLLIGKGIKAIETTKNVIKGFKDINKVREAFSAVKLGDVALKTGKFLNPFTRTADFTYNLARGTGSYKELNNLAKTAKGFGEFYKDVREISLATEEGGMEAATASNTYHQKLIDEYYAKYGKMPEGQDAQDIYEKSKSVRASTQMWNNIIIFYSNRLVLGKLLDGFPSVSLLAKGIEETSTKYLTKTAVGEVLEKGALEAGEKSLGRKTAEFLVKSPYVPWSKSYIVGNLSEALQENAQEAIQKGVIAYHDKVDKDPSQAGFWQGVNHMGDAIGTQFSSEGMSTFFSGFLMGSVAGGAQGLVMGSYQKARSLNSTYKAELDAAKQNAEERETNIINAVNDIAKNAMNIGQKNADNAAISRNYAAEMDNAVNEGNEHKFNEAKDNMAGEKFYTLASTGKMKLITEHFNDMLKATDEELAQAYGKKVEDAPKVRQRLQTLIDRANNFQKIYDKATKEFANPNDPGVADPKRNPELYQKINRKYNAWNQAVKSIVISSEAAERVSGRMTSIANELSSVSPWIETRRGATVSNTAGTDEAMSLIDNYQRKDMIRTLLLEAEALEQGTEEQKEEAAEKRQIAETLKEWGIVTNNFNIELLSEKRTLTPEQKEAKANLMKIREGAVVKTEGSEEEYKVERVIGNQIVTKNKEGKTTYISRDKAQIVRESTLEKKSTAENTLDEAIEMMYDTYTKYLQLVAKQKGGTIIDKEGDAAFKKIRDFFMLERDSQDLTRAINLLSNPLYFNRLYQAEQAVQEKREKDRDERIREAFVAYEKLLKTNSFLNELYDLGLWIFPEEIEAFKKDPRSVTYFDKVKKEVIEPTSETYKKIQVILDKYFPVEKKEGEAKVEEKETEVKVEEEKKPKATQKVTPNITIEQLNKIPELKSILIKLYKNQYVRESKGLTDEQILNTPKFKNFIKTSGTALDQIAKYNLSSEPVIAKEEEVEVVIPDELTDDNWKELIDKAVSERELDKIMLQIDNVNQMNGGLMLAISKKRDSFKEASEAAPTAPATTDAKADIEKNLGIKLSDYIGFPTSSSGAMSWEKMLSGIDNDGYPISEKDQVVLKSGYDLGNGYFAIGYKQNSSSNKISFHIFKKGIEVPATKTSITASDAYAAPSKETIEKINSLASPRLFSTADTDVILQKIDVLKSKYDAELVASEGKAQVDPRKEIEEKIKGLEEQIKTTYRFMGNTDSHAATVQAEKDIKMYEEDLKKLKNELASLEPKPEVKPEEVEAISERTYYQGAETLDEREFNYFTTDKEEAKDYGENVREVRVEPTNPLVYYENREVVDEFNNQNTGQIAEEFKGKFIYVSPGAGKTTLAETNENIVDADQLIIEEINKAYPDFTRKADETDQEFINRFTKNYRTKRVAINNAVRTRVEALLIEGKTVLTGTLAFANDVDLAFTLKASDPKLLKRFSSTQEASDFLAREQETFDNAQKEINILDKPVEKKFTTAARFDLLDNSPEGLATQNAFFKFAKSKGYDAIDFSSKGSEESKYLVSLNNDIIKPATEKKAEVKVEEKVEAKPTGKQRVIVTPDLLAKVDDIASIDELNEFFGDLYENQEAKEKYGLLNAPNAVIKKLHSEFKKRFYKKKDFRTALKGTVGLLTTGQKFVVTSKTKGGLKYRILDASNLPVGEEQTMSKEDFKNNVDIIYKDGMELEEGLFAPVATENKITSNENIEGTSVVLTKEKIDETSNKIENLSKEEVIKKLKDNLGCKK